MDTTRITQQTNRRRSGARSRFGLALPALGVSALVLAGCGGGEMAEQPAEDTSSPAESEQSQQSESSEASGSEASSSEASGSAGETSSSDPSESGGATSSASGSSAGAGAAVDIPSDRAELEEVLGAAEDTLDGSSAVEIDDDDRRGGWDVTVTDGTTEQEVRVSEDLSTQVGESENDDDYDIDPASLEITLADAVERALTEQDGTVTDVSLDEDDGRGIWEVELDDETDVDVDASSGDVLGVER